MIAGQFGAKRIIAIDERITPRNILLLGASEKAGVGDAVEGSGCTRGGAVGDSDCEHHDDHDEEGGE
jgi:hypothetical protein